MIVATAATALSQCRRMQADAGLSCVAPSSWMQAEAGGSRRSCNGNVRKAHPLYQCALKARIR
jgi:hypothetical protein